MRNALISRHALRRLTARASGAAITAAAVILSGLTFGAAPAGAAVTDASITPSVWQPSEQAQAVLTFVSSSASSGTSGNRMSVEIGWGWVYQYANPQNLANNTTNYTATHTVSGGVGTYTCATIGATFSSVGFATPPTTAASVKCQVSRSADNSSDPGQQVRLINVAASGFVFAAPNTVTVTFPAPTITAPATGPASDTWRIIDVGGGLGVTVRTSVPGPDGTIITVPSVTLSFDGNGGTCSPATVTGDQGTWGTALTADQCTNGSRRLAFFSTSPTAASGATNVAPGGPVYFLQDNRLYAIWAADPPSPPTNVVATPGLNSVRVSWAPPASDGGDPIRVYNVRYKATTDSAYGGLCTTNAATFQCTAVLPATNTKYTFVVIAANQAGRAESAPSAPVSPYDFRDVTASRGDVLFGLGGTKVDASGSAPGLVGQSLNAQFKIGSAAEWTTVANGVKVNADSRFSWSRKFPASANKRPVTVRFTYGVDGVSGTYVLPRGGGAGDLSAPRNIKAKAELNKISLTWDPPKFDGGAKIIGYTMCAQYIGTLCRDVGPATQGDFRNLLPGAEYSFTVAARTAAKTGPKGKANKQVTFTEASVRVLEREPGLVTTEVKGKGFKDGAKFRVEVAIVPTNGRPRDTWRWDEIREFRADRSFSQAFGTELGASYDDERLAVRLVTPTGTVYSKPSRPPR